MRRTIRTCGNIILVGLAPAFWSANADAYPSCPPGYEYEPPQFSYTPASYTTGAAGDVAVNTLPTSGASTMQQLVGSVVGALTNGGPEYIHTKLVSKAPAGLNTGSYFTETFPTAMPPSSDTTGEDNICSKVMSPWYTSRLWPGTLGGLLAFNTYGGTGLYYEDAEPGILVKAFGSTNCTGVPLDSYHLRSVLDDNIQGGSCEKLLVDYCSVPVSSTLDRTKYTATESTNAINDLFADVYGYCMGIIGGQWPWGGVGCGGTSEQIGCQRASWQIVNEAYYTAGPDFWDAGWSDYNVTGSVPNPNGPYPPANYNATSGTLMGASKSNQADTSTGGLCPGFCNDGSCNTTPTGSWSCAGSAYQPTSLVANIPQNIINAATRLKATQQTVILGSGITASSNKMIFPGGCVK
jgi:hypothetical protein